MTPARARRTHPVGGAEHAQSSTEGARAEDARTTGAELDALKRTLDSETKRHTDSDALGKSLREEVLGLSERAGLIEDALRNLAERHDDGETSLRLGEAEFLLRLGAERHRLFRDPTGAATAFELADGVLAELDDCSTRACARPSPRSRRAPCRAGPRPYRADRAPRRARTHARRPAIRRPGRARDTGGPGPELVGADQGRVRRRGAHPPRRLERSGDARAGECRARAPGALTRPRAGEGRHRGRRGPARARGARQRHAPQRRLAAAGGQARRHVPARHHRDLGRVAGPDRARDRQGAGRARQPRAARALSLGTRKGKDKARP